MCCLRDMSRPRSLLQPEEGRPGPAGAGDSLGHLAQGQVRITPIEEGSLRCCSDLVGLPLPFAEEPGASFDAMFGLRAGGACTSRCRPAAEELHAGGA